MLYTRPYNMFMNYIAYYELYSQFGDMLYTTLYTRFLLCIAKVVYNIKCTLYNTETSLRTGGILPVIW